VLAPTYPLETARLTLRPFVHDDLHDLHAIYKRADVARFLYAGPRDRDAMRGVLAEKAERAVLREPGRRLDLAVVRRDSGALIGDVTLLWTSREYRQGEIGFVFHPDHHGHGFATEAAAVLLRLAFEDLGLHRIFGRLDGRNVASVRLLERLGMRREAHLRENELVKGEWTDEMIYALLDREWRERTDRLST
jgi:RimJ/RimL family protein N-acetyltransferase